MVNKAQLIAEKKAIDAFKIGYLDHNDRKVVQYVIRSLKGTSANVVTGESAQFSSIVAKSLEDFDGVFGRTLTDATMATAAKVSVQNIYPAPHCFSLNVSYIYDVENKITKKDSGSIGALKIPSQFFEEDRVFLGHEFLHMNKDLNFEEYKLLMVCSDVLTMLYEFIVMGEDAKSVITNRIGLLKKEVEGYEMATNCMKKSAKEKDLYKIIQSRSGQYLNSFYYATILYKMYQDNPSLILGYMKKVLNREMTTLDMLKELGLYLVDNNEIYNNQLLEFKRVMK